MLHLYSMSRTWKIAEPGIHSGPIPSALRVWALKGGVLVGAGCLDFDAGAVHRASASVVGVSISKECEHSQF